MFKSAISLLKKDLIQSNLIMLLVLIPGILLFSFNTIGFDFSFFPGDLGDARLNLYFLEHCHLFFSGKIQSFWNAPFMFPEHNVLTYSDNLLGSAPIFSLFRSIGFDIFKSFQLWYLVVTALNYICAFYFLKYILGNNYAAALGAFIFAFSIALQSQLSHAQTFPRFAIPLAFLYAVKFSKEFEPRYFLFTLLFIVYQIYCGIYLGLMLSIPIGIYFLILFVKKLINDKRLYFNRTWLIAMILYSLLIIIILIPIIHPYLERKIPPSLEHYQEIFQSLPTINSHLFSQEGSLFWDSLSKVTQHYTAWWDHQIFAGGIATACLILSFIVFIYLYTVSKQNTSAYSNIFILLLTGLITIIFYIRFDDFSPYYLIYHLPGFSSMRSLARIINIELIFFALATAFMYSFIIKKYLKYNSLLFGISFFILIGDNYFFQDKMYRTKLSLAKDRLEGIQKTFEAIPAGSVVSYEPLKLESASIYYQIDAMLAAQKYNLKTINGYTARCPGEFSLYWNEPNENNRNYWLLSKKSDLDTLYVIMSLDSIEKINYKGILQKMRLENLINYIKTDNKWMQDIEQKAIKNNISLDSMVILDAIWIIENEK
jgi:hypothetical protein